MENAADFDSVSGSDKEESVIGDAESEFVSSLKGLHIARAGLGKSGRVAKMRMAVGLSRRRTSALAGSVQIIRFIVPCCSGRSLPG